jgi:hypothetical protein
MRRHPRRSPKWKKCASSMGRPSLQRTPERMRVHGHGNRRQAPPDLCSSPGLIQNLSDRRAARVPRDSRKRRHGHLGWSLLHPRRRQGRRNHLRPPTLRPTTHHHQDPLVALADARLPFQTRQTHHRYPYVVRPFPLPPHSHPHQHQTNRAPPAHLPVYQK